MEGGQEELWTAVEAADGSELRPGPFGRSGSFCVSRCATSRGCWHISDILGYSLPLRTAQVLAGGSEAQALEHSLVLKIYNIN